ncbi:MAG: histidinol-phosphate transaminase [Bacteroidetes bacterium]|nr:histidinol-phosphate transaminase [Bacteroidota bacterium]MDA1122084.1 histidinol-phosphate transaminase [Bacteroidota bacterium]
MDRLKKFVRPHILTIKPYSSARDDFKGSAEVYLDANENSYGPVTGGDFNRYPDPHQTKLKGVLSKVKGVSPDQIFIGNGSDEPIDLLIRAFCEPERNKIVILPPTYGMYKVSALINNVGVIEIPLTIEFQIDTDQLKKTSFDYCKIIFICSPNNPSGNLLNSQTIIEILEEFDGLVVVDEAYIDFAQETSLIEKLEQYPNLVILQTFSKAWGLAAIRLGIAYGNPYIIEILNKIKPPYNINKASQEMGIQALEIESTKNEVVEKIVAERNLLAKKLKALSFVREIVPSNANFLLVRFDNSESINDFLRKRNIIVRDRSRELHCEGCLRITIGTPVENDRLIQVLNEL